MQDRACSNFLSSSLAYPSKILRTKGRCRTVCQENTVEDKMRRLQEDERYILATNITSQDKGELPLGSTWKEEQCQEEKGIWGLESSVREVGGGRTSEHSEAKLEHGAEGWGGIRQ